MKYPIKEATFEDCAEIARVHVHSWQQTYIDLVPQHCLDRMSIPSRQQKWEELFQDKAKNLHVAYDSDEVVGFISFGQNRDQRKNGCGEIYAVYLLKKSWSKGIGYALFEKAKQKLFKDGMSSAYLWVLDTNANAISSYKKWGGIIDDNMILDAEIGGQPVREVMINFDLQ